MSGFTTNLLTALAEHLDDADLGTYSTDTAYSSEQTAITIKHLPQEPDAAIVLTPYSVTDGAARTADVIGIQIQCRAGTDPCDVDDLTDALFDNLHGARLVLADIPVTMLRRSHTSIGQDDNGRWSTTSNYYAWVDRPSAHRTA